MTDNDKIVLFCKNNENTSNAKTRNKTRSNKAAKKNDGENIERAEHAQQASHVGIDHRFVHANFPANSIGQ